MRRDGTLVSRRHYFGRVRSSGCGCRSGAREEALASGHPVVFVDEVGRLVQELPDGRQFEVRLEGDQPREAYVRAVGKLPAAR